MTRHTIELNFRQASAQASRLEEQAEAVRAIADGMERLTSSDYWPYPTYSEILYSIR